MGVSPLLISQNLEFVLGVLLHKDVVLVQYLDGLVDLQDFTSLHVFEVDLPLLGIFVKAVELALQVAHLMLHELLESAHDFFDPGHLFGKRLVRESRVLD